MLVPCGTACTLPPVAGLLRSVLVPSGTAPPTPPSHPHLPRCWFLAEPHLSPLPGASIHSFCGFQIQKIPCAPLNSLSILPLLVELIILFYASVCHMCTIRMCTSELTLWLLSFRSRQNNTSTDGWAYHTFPRVLKTHEHQTNLPIRNHIFIVFIEMTSKSFIGCIPTCRSCSGFVRSKEYIPAHG